MGGLQFWKKWSKGQGHNHTKYGQKGRGKRVDGFLSSSI